MNFTDNSARVEKEIAFADAKVAKSNKTSKLAASGILRKKTNTALLLDAMKFQEKVIGSIIADPVT